MTKTVFDKIDAQKRELDQRRALTPRSIAALDAWFDVDLTYTSNAIEGNTLTRNETAIVIEKGITVRGKPLKDHLEAVDHYNAILAVRQTAKSSDPLTEDDILAIHKMVLDRSQPDDAGIYSQFQRRIAGSAVVLPAPHKIPSLMGTFSGWLKDQPNTYQTAFEAHQRLVTIHPFSDGNGRTARLLMNLVLLRGGYPPISIGPEQRENYIDTLEHAQLSGDSKPFHDFLATRLANSLDQYLDAITKELEARPSVPKL